MNPQQMAYLSGEGDGDGSTALSKEGAKEAEGLDEFVKATANQDDDEDEDDEGEGDEQSAAAGDDVSISSQRLLAIAEAKSLFRLAPKEFKRKRKDKSFIWEVMFLLIARNANSLTELEVLDSAAHEALTGDNDGYDIYICSACFDSVKTSRKKQEQ